MINKKGELSGIISMTDIRTVMADDLLQRLVIAKDLATSDIITVTPEDSLNTATKITPSLNVRKLPFVDKNERKRIISILTEEDILRAY